MTRMARTNPGEPVAHTVRWPTGTWTVTEWRPPPGDPLVGWVERIWHAAGKGGGRAYRALPHGMVELVALRDGRFRVRTRRREATVSRSWHVQIGARTEPLWVERMTSRFEVIGARLHPILAARLLGPAVGGLDAVLDFALVQGSTLEPLDEALRREASGPGQLRRLRHWLLDGAAACVAGVESNPVAARASEEIIRAGGALRIGELEEKLGVSKRRLLERFRRQVGVTPKRFARAHRFRAVLRHLAEAGRAGCDVASTRDVSLSDLAYSAGYADQAHMTNEFREMSGLTPGEFLASLARYRAAAFRLMDAAYG